MKRKLAYLLVISFLFSVMGCNKQEKGDDTTVRMIAGTWQQVLLEHNVNESGWEDHTDACDLEEIVEMAGDKAHALSLYSNDPSQCGDQIYTGRWDIVDEDKTLVWNIDGLSAPFQKKIVSLSESTLVTIHDPGTVTPTQIRITYRKR